MKKLSLALLLLSSICRADIFGNGNASGSSSSASTVNGTIALGSQNAVAKYTATGSSNTIGGDTALSSDGSTLVANENINILNAQGGLYISNGQSSTNNASGVNLQSTPTSAASFDGGLLGFNLAYNVAVSSYLVSNDFGTDYFGMMIQRGGTVDFVGNNATASNTFLTHAQVLASSNFHIAQGSVSAPFGMTVGTFTATGYIQEFSQSVAQLAASIPTAVGQKFYCNNCTTVPECISTGTVRGAYSVTTNKATACS